MRINVETVKPGIRAHVDVIGYRTVESVEYDARPGVDGKPVVTLYFASAGGTFPQYFSEGETIGVEEYMDIVPAGEPWESDSVFCQWFALCGNVATGAEPHPILGDVPICDRCAEKVAKLKG